MKKVFIDGSAGTTGLRIRERLSARKDVLLITLPENLRKDVTARKDAINSADVAFLCLPDLAAIEAVSLVENNTTVIIDTSTAHRTLPEFAYGFPEIDENIFEKVRSSKRIAVPGCHASGFIALVYPLVKAGVIPKNTLLTCTSITGYSGGGKQMIAEYQSESRSKYLDSPRQYGITQHHKHLKEIVHIAGLENAPVFMPIVADFYSGMEVTVPLFKSQINGSVETIKEIYEKTYTGPIVNYKPDMSENGFMASNILSHKDSMDITVHGNEDRILLVSRYDNLGKGASGAAIECFNIVTGVDITQGLEL